MVASQVMPTVLVVDDSWYMQELLRDSLEAWGYRVLSASSVGSAADIVTDEHPEVAIMDVVLPELDGIYGTLALRALDPYLEIVVVSGWATADMRARAMRVGAAGFIAKPYVEEQLRNTLCYALSRRFPGHANCCDTG